MKRHLTVAIVMGVLFFGLLYLLAWLLDLERQNDYILTISIVCAILWGIEDWWRVRRGKKK
jgi:hypothetical protein